MKLRLSKFSSVCAQCVASYAKGLMLNVLVEEKQVDIEETQK
jgi:hypothetical protein